MVPRPYLTYLLVGKVRKDDIPLIAWLRSVYLNGACRTWEQYYGRPRLPPGIGVEIRQMTEGKD